MLVPVTLTRTVEAKVNVHDRVELLGRVTATGVRLQAVLSLARLTTPLKPLKPVTAIVDVLGDPAFTVTDVGLAEIVKS